MVEMEPFLHVLLDFITSLCNFAGLLATIHILYVFLISFISYVTVVLVHSNMARVGIIMINIRDKSLRVDLHNSTTNYT